MEKVQRIWAKEKDPEEADKKGPPLVTKTMFIGENIVRQNQFFLKNDFTLFSGFIYLRATPHSLQDQRLNQGHRQWKPGNPVIRWSGNSQNHVLEIFKCFHQCIIQPLSLKVKKKHFKRFKCTAFSRTVWMLLWNNFCCRIRSYKLALIEAMVSQNIIHEHHHQNPLRCLLPHRFLSQEARPTELKMAWTVL